MFETKGQPLKWSIKYEDKKDTKQAELMADLLNYYYESNEGRIELEASMRKTAQSLIERGFIISEGTS